MRQDNDGVVLICPTANGATMVRGSHAVECTGSRGEGLRRILGVSFEGESVTDPFLICDIGTDLGNRARKRRFYFDREWNPGRQPNAPRAAAERCGAQAAIKPRCLQIARELGHAVVRGILLGQVRPPGAPSCLLYQLELSCQGEPPAQN